MPLVKGTKVMQAIEKMLATITLNAPKQVWERNPVGTVTHILTPEDVKKSLATHGPNGTQIADYGWLKVDEYGSNFVKGNKKLLSLNKPLAIVEHIAKDDWSDDKGVVRVKKGQIQPRYTLALAKDLKLELVE